MKKITIKKIVKIVENNITNCKIDDTMINEDLVNLGMNSINFIQLIVSLEQSFKCEIPDSKLLIQELNTIKKIYDLLIYLSKEI